MVEEYVNGASETHPRMIAEFEAKQERLRLCLLFSRCLEYVGFLLS